MIYFYCVLCQQKLLVALIIREWVQKFRGIPTRVPIKLSNSLYSEPPSKTNLATKYRNHVWGTHTSRRKLFSKSLIIVVHYICHLLSKPETTGNRRCPEMSCRIQENGTQWGMSSFFQLWRNHIKPFPEKVTEYKCYALADLFIPSKVKDEKARDLVKKVRD